MKSRNKAKIKKHKSKPVLDLPFDGLNELDTLDMEFLDQIVATHKYSHSESSSEISEKEALQTILEIKGI